MNLELRSQRVNGAGELIGTVAVMDASGVLLFEDSLNLSKARQREALVQEIAQRAKVTSEQARKELLRLMQAHRAALLQEAKEEAPKRVRKADQLVNALLEKGPLLFADQYGEPHIALPEDISRAIFRVRSSAFRDRLANLGYVEMGEVPSSETVRAALAVIAGKAAFDGEVLPLHVRTAWHGDDLWYDLGDWRGVKITAAGWEVVEQPPVLFRRLPHQRAQVEPVPGGNVRDILDLLTLKKDEHQCVLFLTDLVAGLVPGIPRPLSVFHGPHGSTKTTALRMKRELQDPVEVPVQGPPRDLAEFVQLASHNLCLFLDNLSSLPEWLSDALSRFCTGDGFTKRALYTTDEDYFYRPQGIGGLTGVNLVVTAPDLLDRSFIYQMDRLAEGEYLPESELRQRFEAMKPGLLGAMFSTLSAAVGLHPQLKARPLPRLADYALWAVASAIALGYDEHDYWQAYAANIGAQTREALDASPVAQAVLHLMDGRKEWSGTPSELLLALNAIAEELKIDSKARAWPKDAGWVTRRLTLVLPNLAQVGIQVRTSHDGKNRQVALQRKGNDVSGVSPVSGHKEGVKTTNGTNIKTGTPGGKVGQKQERPIDPCLCPREEWTEGVIGESCPTCEYKLRCPECGGCRTCGHKLAREHADD